MPRIEPGAAGCEARRPSLCCAAICYIFNFREVSCFQIPVQKVLQLRALTIDVPLWESLDLVPDNLLVTNAKGSPRLLAA